ncbi:hypothetical protein OHA91_38560 [Streptomyces erythrochromogenes]|uniref:CsbD family protein n=1 Tax=Streptomyces erythrochromogenes TaxID=285574 RepID=A0ABZ1QNA9_9ACTN|nr:hypothetical protein [Streptomyces erythrochromogenes]
MGMNDKGKRLKEAAKGVMDTGEKEATEQHGQEPQDGLKGRLGEEDRQASFDGMRNGVDDR